MDETHWRLNAFSLVEHKSKFEIICMLHIFRPSFFSAFVLSKLRLASALAAAHLFEASEVVGVSKYLAQRVMKQPIVAHNVHNVIFGRTIQVTALKVHFTLFVSAVQNII